MVSPPRPLALVTGASSGIGADLARELAKDGHDLVLTARSPAPMEALAEELERDGANSIIIPADLSNPEARKELANELHYSGDTNDSAAMNIWLHKQVIQKLAENGGKVPADLLK